MSAAAAAAAADLGGAEVLPGSPAPSPLPHDTAFFIRKLRRYATGAAASSSSSGADDVVTDPRLDGSTDTSSWTQTDWTASSMFNWRDPVVVSRAPGRLDVMGGIADYSGSLVLQMPIAEACHVALQLRPEDDEVEAGGTVTIVSPSPSPSSSSSGNQEDRSDVFEMRLEDLLGNGEDGSPPMTYPEARAMFAENPTTHWAAYVAGVFLVLAREKGVTFFVGDTSRSSDSADRTTRGGAAPPPRRRDSVSILLHSDVPEGKGVSSSAAVEVATMCAVVTAYDVDVNVSSDGGRELAMLCQKVENLVVGAPCGVMDQMASACGRENTLLSLLCRPAEVMGHLALPRHAGVWGIDSGVRHYVGGSDYGKVRAGAFMGRTMIRSFYKPPPGAGKGNGNGNGRGEGVGSLVGDGGELRYLTDVPPHVFESPSFAERLPPEGCAMSGASFLARHPRGHGDDDVTTIDPDDSYDVTGPARHPVMEHHRVRSFAAILGGGGGSTGYTMGKQSGGGGTIREMEDEQLCVLGELMYQSDAGYGRLGLGSDGTDEIVRLARDALGPARGVYGAKITGGGSGGTVCVLGRSDDGTGEKAVEEICELYEKTTGRKPYVFRGSSPGAVSFDHLRVKVLP